MIVIKEMEADISHPDFIPRLTCVQGDSGRVVQLRPLLNGAPWTIPGGTDVMIRYQNARGEGGTYDTLPDGSPAYEIADGKIRVCLTEQVCAAAGITRVQVVLLWSKWQVTAAEFALEVVPAAAGKLSGDYVNLSKWLQEHGITPKKGEDYWTSEDVAEIHSYIDTQLGVIEYGAY